MRKISLTNLNVKPIESANKNTVKFSYERPILEAHLYWEKVAIFSNISKVTESGNIRLDASSSPETKWLLISYWVEWMRK